MDKKNLLFIIYDLERGGPEMRLLDFAKHFPDDLKMHICVTSNNLALLKRFQNCNVRITVLPISKPYLEFGKILSIYKYVKDNRISIINSFDLKSLLISVFIKIIGRGSIKTVFHVVNSLNNFTRRQTILFRSCVKLIDTFVCNSLFSKHLIESKYLSKGNTEVIYNGVDTSYFRQNRDLKIRFREELNIAENEIVMGTIANFRKEKNYPFLIDAFRTLLNKYQQVRLLCVGGGKDLEKTKRVVNAYGLGKKVIFTGYTEDVFRYLNVLDIFVLCSSCEGSPNVLLQAMSMGVPVVCSSVGGCPEIIEHLESGILFAPNNKDEFLNGVVRLIEDHKLSAKLAHKAHIMVNEKFALSSMIENYSKLYSTNKC
jgi:glycosyltransferase involved in cell wall biosynthesis